MVADIVNSGRGVGISSLRADRLTPRLLEDLRRGGYRTITVASDGISQRMRDALDRGIKEEHLLSAARLIRDRWDSLAVAPACKAPVLMLHGGMDKTVPIAHAMRLFHELPEPKHFVHLDAAGHVDLFDHGGAAHVLDWLAERGL